MKKKLYLLLLSLFCSLISFATHNNAGEIIYRQIDTVGPVFSPTYEIIIITYTDPNSQADRDSLDLVIRNCSNQQVLQTLSVKRNKKSLVNNVIQRNEYTIASFTFPGTGCYILSMLDPNRIAGIQNITVSVNVPFYIESVLMIPDPQIYGYNNSPILYNPPIAFAKVGVPFTYNPAAYEPDGDSLTFELIPPKSDPNTDVPGYYIPNNHPQQTPPGIFTIDKNNGELYWESPYIAAIYNVAILVKEYRRGQLIGTLIRDMQIRVTDNDNHQPELSELNDTCIVAGASLSKILTGTDMDAMQILTITATGGAFNLSSNPASFNTTASVSPVTGQFNWNTNCDHIRPGSYTIVFTLMDNYTAPGPGGLYQPYMDVETWVIRVVAPPPQNLQAVQNANSIDLTWQNPYQCSGASNFRGFSVWRKIGCDSSDVDVCDPTALSSLGYVKISGTTPITAYSYNDNTVSNGLIYSYRVVAEFAESIFPGSPFTYNNVSSAPSNGACVELKKNIAIITNVDVITTDDVAGVIDVKWLKPFADEVDTVNNAGPYKFELYRYEGQTASGAPTTVFTTTSPTFAGLNDTSFTDAALNTRTKAWSYKVGFFASNSSGQFYKLGDSDSASSVFLTVGSGSNQLFLSWTVNVPWQNYEYIVFKETPTGSNNFVVLDTVAVLNYLDKNLTNGENYCYKIRTIGSYFNPQIDEPLINHSQIACGIPRDTVPPCTPDLTVTNDCLRGVKQFDPSLIYNELRWNNPNNSCAADVAQYKVYFSPTPTGELTLLATLNSAEDTSYLHEITSGSLAGCYAVTALDSVGNESIHSEKICVDNCPLYKLPNAFTPNGDGHNDHFKPFMPYMFVDHIDIKIFNQWGNLVFQSSDPDILWNGKQQNNGKNVSEGVYYYVCDVYYTLLDGVKKGDQLSGYIHLIRGNGNSN